MMKTVSILIKVFIVCSLWLSGTSASAQETMKTCTGAQVRLINVSGVYNKKNLLDAKPEIIVVRALTSSTMPGATGKAVSIIALGPVLGSMDSPAIKTALACTAKGFTLTATITRTADYDGAVLANIIWRPKIEITVVLLQPEVIFETIWKMRLTTGAEVYLAQTPTYPEQNYPISVTTAVR
ncbi:MAG: hypothetical protein ACYCSS_10865 [Sulfuriferula sp.]